MVNELSKLEELSETTNGNLLENNKFGDIGNFKGGGGLEGHHLKGVDGSHSSNLGRSRAGSTDTNDRLSSLG